MPGFGEAAGHRPGGPPSPTGACSPQDPVRRRGSGLNSRLTHEPDSVIPISRRRNRGGHIPAPGHTARKRQGGAGAHGRSQEVPASGLPPRAARGAPGPPPELREIKPPAQGHTAGCWRSRLQPTSPPPWRAGTGTRRPPGHPLPSDPPRGAPNTVGAAQGAAATSLMTDRWGRGANGAPRNQPKGATAPGQRRARRSPGRAAGGPGPRACVPSPQLCAPALPAPRRPRLFSLCLSPAPLHPCHCQPGPRGSPTPRLRSVPPGWAQCREPTPHAPLSVPLPLPHGYSRSRIRVQILPLVLGCLSFCLGEMGIIQEPPSIVHGSAHEQVSDVSPQVWELCPLSWPACGHTQHLQHRHAPPTVP